MKYDRFNKDRPIKIIILSKHFEKRIFLTKEMIENLAYPKKELWKHILEVLEKEKRAEELIFNG